MTELGSTRIDTLLRLGAVIHGEWSDVLEQILRRDSETLEIGRVSYWRLHDDPPQAICELGYQAEGEVLERGTVLSARLSPAYFDAVNHVELVAVEDVYRDPRTADLVDYLAERQITSLLDVPIWMGGRPVGVLSHEHVGELRHWTEAEKEFAVATSQALVAALQARERTRAEIAEGRSAFLRDVAYRFAEIRDPSEVERAAVRAALPTLGDAAVLDALFDNQIRRSAAAHVDPDKQAQFEAALRAMPLRLDGPQLAVRAIKRNTAVFVPVIEHARRRGEIAERYAAYLEELAVKSAIAVPLRVRNRRALGALVLYAHERIFEHADLRLAEEFAYIVATSFDNARLYRQAKDAIRARDEFISMASHEIRTPLSSLRAAAEALVRDLSSPLAKDRVARVVVRQVDRLDRLAQRMIDTTQIHAGDFKIRRERVDLAERVRKVVGEFSALMERSHCGLELRADEPVIGYFDRARLDTVIANLLENAVKFGKGRPIVVEVEAGERTASLCVRDHGIGMQQAEADEVFVPYRRAVSPWSYGGLGLGLYVVRSIARAHGGDVRIEGREGGGADVIVELPYGEADSSPR